jgi:hypothetical protein
MVHSERVKTLNGKSEYEHQINVLKSHFKRLEKGHETLSQNIDYNPWQTMCSCIVSGCFLVVFFYPLSGDFLQHLVD